MNNIKQVIVIRNDLNLCKGKMIAHGGHASMEFLLKGLKEDILNVTHGIRNVLCYTPTEIEFKWFWEGRTKIAVQVNSEKELLDIYNQAKDVGIKAFIIEDKGTTEVPPNTKISMAIGPDYSEKIDKITRHLKLL